MPLACLSIYPAFGCIFTGLPLPSTARSLPFCCPYLTVRRGAAAGMETASALVRALKTVIDMVRNTWSILPKLLP